MKRAAGISFRDFTKGGDDVVTASGVGKLFCQGPRSAAASHVHSVRFPAQLQKSVG